MLKREKKAHLQTLQMSLQFMQIFFFIRQVDMIMKGWFKENLSPLSILNCFKLKWVRKTCGKLQKRWMWFYFTIKKNSCLRFYSTNILLCLQIRQNTEGVFGKERLQKFQTRLSIANPQTQSLVLFHPIRHSCIFIIDNHNAAHDDCQRHPCQ